MLWRWCWAWELRVPRWARSQEYSQPWPGDEASFHNTTSPHSLGCPSFSPLTTAFLSKVSHRWLVRGGTGRGRARHQGESLGTVCSLRAESPFRSSQVVLLHSYPSQVFFHIPSSPVSSSFAFLTLSSSPSFWTQRTSESPSLTFQQLAFLYKFPTLWSCFRCRWQSSRDKDWGRTSGQGTPSDNRRKYSRYRLIPWDIQPQFFGYYSNDVFIWLLFQNDVKLTLASPKFTLPTT